MGLLDDLKDPNNFAEPVRAKCKLCELLKELEQDEAKALEARLNDPKIGHTALADVLKKNGYNISRASVYRHRKDSNVKR